jgi:hypothetical protein
MSRVYGDGADAAYRALEYAEEEWESERLSHARVGGLRLLHRCRVMLDFIDEWVIHG